jgi:hypothetical protein
MLYRLGGCYTKGCGVWGVEDKDFHLLPTYPLPSTGEAFA